MATPFPEPGLLFGVDEGQSVAYQQIVSFGENSLTLLRFPFTLLTVGIFFYLKICYIAAKVFFLFN